MDEVRVLIADSQTYSRTVIKSYASMEGFTCDEAPDGINAIKLFRRNDYGIIVLDIQLPELDAYNVCRQMRKVTETPIFILSPRNEEDEKLRFFEAGADDFILKPFFPRELIARFRVHLRHSPSAASLPQRRIVFGGLCIDLVSRAVFIDGQNIELTPREYSLLLYLAKNPHKAMSREKLLNEVWGEEFFGTDRTVDTHIKSLRENIKPYDEYIGTVWGYGYIFRADVT